MLEYLLKSTVGHTKKEYQTHSIFIFLLLAVYIFFVAIGLIQESLKIIGQDYIREFVENNSNPFVMLFVGLLVTAIIQSSSTTSSILVILVSAQIISLNAAVPMIMGANIGTTITSTFFALGYVNNKADYRRAIGAATAHDFFNLCTAVILFPLEYYFGFLSHIAQFLAKSFWIFPKLTLNEIDFQYNIFKPTVHFISYILSEKLWLLLSVSVIMLLLALKFFALLIKELFVRGKRLNSYFFNRPYMAVLTGFVMTSIMQSSSAMTSMLIPLVVIRKISVRQVFPFIVGTNIGTTITALIVAFNHSEVAMSVALVHFLFNFIGFLIFFPIPFLRNIPLNLALYLGKISWEKQYIGFLYIFLIFFIIPFFLIYFS